MFVGLSYVMKTGSKPASAQNEVNGIRPLLSVVTLNGVFKISTDNLDKEAQLFGCHDVSP